MLKLKVGLEGDHATHLWDWIERPIAQNLVLKCSYVADIIKGRPMMWVSSTMDGNRQEKKWLAIKRKGLKWTNVNSGPPKGWL